MPTPTQAQSSCDDATPRFYQQARITQVDPQRMRVKCEIPGRRSGSSANPIESPWVRVFAPLNSQSGFRDYGNPQKDDRGLLILNQNGNKGVWIGGYYNEKRSAPYNNADLRGWKHDDGAESYYDAAAPKFFETTPGDRVTHADVNQSHTADKLYEIEAEVVQLRTKSGASLTLTKMGAIVFQNALGQRFVLGGDTGSSLLPEYTFGAGGASIQWEQVGSFTLNGQAVTTVTHTHPLTGEANTPGTYPTVF
jgi:phage baseplate assembly protein gpV